MSDQQSLALPQPTLANKFHDGNGDDGKHYWLTPPGLYDVLNAEFRILCANHHYELTLTGRISGTDIVQG